MSQSCEHLDPRVRRTRQLLLQAFFELLSTKDFAAISVQDIAEKATVNRATFYDHFPDKLALLDYTIEDQFQQLLRGRMGRRDTCGPGRASPDYSRAVRLSGGTGTALSEAPTPVRTDGGTESKGTGSRRFAELIEVPKPSGRISGARIGRDYGQLGHVWCCARMEPEQASTGRRILPARFCR